MDMPNSLSTFWVVLPLGRVLLWLPAEGSPDAAPAAATNMLWASRYPWRASGDGIDGFAGGWEEMGLRPLSPPGPVWTPKPPALEILGLRLHSFKKVSAGAILAGSVSQRSSVWDRLGGV